MKSKSYISFLRKEKNMPRSIENMEVPEHGEGEEQLEQGIEGLKEITPVTREELAELYSGVDAGLGGVDMTREVKWKMLEENDPKAYERLKDIEDRRMEEFRSITEPRYSTLHEMGLSTTEFVEDKEGRRIQRAPVKSSELLQEKTRVETWLKEWQSLSEEEKRSREHRESELLYLEWAYEGRDWATTKRSENPYKILRVELLSNQLGWLLVRAEEKERHESGEDGPTSKDEFEERLQLSKERDRLKLKGERIKSEQEKEE